MLRLLLVLVNPEAAYVWALTRDPGAAGPQWVTEAVAIRPLTVTVTATGTVQPTTQVDVSSELSGTVAAVEVDYNDSVEAGQPLARLDDTKLRAQLANAEASAAAATARLAQAEATLREAEANYLTEAELDRRGVSTQRSVTAYETAFAQARAAVDIARADLSLAQANLALHRADLAKAVIRSPIRGVVLDRAVDAGQIVAASLQAPTLFTLAEDLARMQLQVDVDEADIGRVAVGQTASFTVDAFPDRVFPATIAQVRFAPETSDGVVTYKAILTVDNADLALRPGMTATATVTVAHQDAALVVPNAALRFTPPVAAEDEGSRGGGLLGLIMPRAPVPAPPLDPGAPRQVWVLRDGTPVAVPVTTGDTDGRITAILSGDLAPGAAVITDQAETDAP
ncbi:MAG: efflux RND transporter periplasmic adaptor subunit [Rhodobacterales bacterium]|nr:efflux RND transporter periplasmic adaptor subunit [Rhodobacterales bacterium]